MPLILHIDTALQKAFAGIASDGQLLMGLENDEQQTHAAFVQPAIQQLMGHLNLQMQDIDAVGVTGGPGSYTGLRVAMASAKGLCYALNKPLLIVSTLEIMAQAAIEKFPGFDMYCAMIDARREEVYTAIFTKERSVMLSPSALILDDQSFKKQLSEGQLLFFGNGSSKLGKFLPGKSNANFVQVDYENRHLANIFFNLFINNQFVDLAYAEPTYIKDFHFGISPGVGKKNI